MLPNTSWLGLGHQWKSLSWIETDRWWKSRNLWVNNQLYLCIRHCTSISRAYHWEVACRCYLASWHTASCPQSEKWCPSQRAHWCIQHCIWEHQCSLWSYWKHRNSFERSPCFQDLIWQWCHHYLCRRSCSFWTVEWLECALMSRPRTKQKAWSAADDMYLFLDPAPSVGHLKHEYFRVLSLNSWPTCF